MLISLKPVFNSLIFSSSRGKNDLLLQPDDIIEDLFALLTRIQEEMEANALEKDLKIEELKSEIRTSLDI